MELQRASFDGKAFDVVLVVLVIVLLAAAAVFVFGDEEAPEEQRESPETMPGTLYNVTDQGVLPYSHEVRPEESVGVLNSRPDDIVVSSDSLPQNQEIKSEEFKVFEFDRIAYFEVNDSEGLVGTGKINVQRG